MCRFIKRAAFLLIASLGPGFSQLGAYPRRGALSRELPESAELNESLTRKSGLFCF